MLLLGMLVMVVMLAAVRLVYSIRLTLTISALLKPSLSVPAGRLVRVVPLEKAEPVAPVAILLSAHFSPVLEGPLLEEPMGLMAPVDPAQVGVTVSLLIPLMQSVEKVGLLQVAVMVEVLNGVVVAVPVEKIQVLVRRAEAQHMPLPVVGPVVP